MTNILYDTDSYKFSHWEQYPPNTSAVSSYIEARTGGLFEEVLFFGLQAWIKGNLIDSVTPDTVEALIEDSRAHGYDPNVDGFRRLIGRPLPVSISAIPEGTVVPCGNMLVQVTNTDPEFFWLTSFLETSILRSVWYPSTVATLSREVKKRIYAGLKITSDTPEAAIPFKLHDFGSRGASSRETAMIGGGAHLVNFMGTDTFIALKWLREFYGAPMAGFSIPASEHSTITSWGRDGEVAAYENMLNKFARPGSILACVSDSYDIFNAVDHLWGGELRDKVKSSGATLVIRPDSGDPIKMAVEVTERLMEKFGYTENSKGYRVLDPCVRVIQGDGVNLDSITHIVGAFVDRGLSLDNIAFGMGAGLLQNVNRDTLRFAMKASEVTVDGVRREVFKDPITDQGKKSKKGRLAVVNECGLGSCGYRTVPVDEAEHMVAERVDREVYRDGTLLVDDSFSAIRERASL